MKYFLIDDNPRALYEIVAYAASEGADCYWVSPDGEELAQVPGGQKYYEASEEFLAKLEEIVKRNNVDGCYFFVDIILNKTDEKNHIAYEQARVRNHIAHTCSAVVRRLLDANATVHLVSLLNGLEAGERWKEMLAEDIRERVKQFTHYNELT